MGRGKPDRSGRSGKMPPFTPLLHGTMDSAAFRSLSPLAECIYTRLVRRAGYKAARNGEVFYSVREGAAEFGKNKDTISAAFHELQARGFIVPTQIGWLGKAGEGKATTWRLTDWPTPSNPSPTREYLSWQEGQDFPVVKGKSPRQAKQNPVPESRTACPTEPDVSPQAGAVLERARPTEPDVSADFGGAPVLLGRTPKDLPG